MNTSQLDARIAELTAEVEKYKTLASDNRVMAASLITERDELRSEVERLTKERDGVEYCEECQHPLTACGKQGVDGIPTMDCNVCRLRSLLTEMKADRDQLAAELAAVKASVESAYTEAAPEFAMNYPPIETVVRYLLASDARRKLEGLSS